ncbi:MAG: hypothetical protein HYR67_08150 [Bacteroidetes bacterium]|nr:hypothetical protein [Bacteroidota bacterium]
MTKKYLGHLLIICLFLLLTSFQQNKPIKSQIKWLCDSKWKKISKEEQREFDEKGNLVQWLQFTSNASICDTFKYEYEGKKIVKEYRTTCYSDLAKGTVTQNKYGTNDRLEEKQSFERKKLTKVSKFKFKSASDKYPYIREDYFDNEQNATTIANLKYDSRGNLIEEEQNVSGSWFGTFTYKFGSKNQLIYETGSVDGGVGLVERYYIYDKDILVKDSVRIPGSPTEFHVYETKKL